jgi:hypothetical protein
MSRRAWAWTGVGSDTFWKVTSLPGNRTVFLVRVASSASRPRKL